MEFRTKCWRKNASVHRFEIYLQFITQTNPLNGTGRKYCFLNYGRVRGRKKQNWFCSINFFPLFTDVQMGWGSWGGRTVPMELREIIIIDNIIHYTGSKRCVGVRNWEKQKEQIVQIVEKQSWAKMYKRIILWVFLYYLLDKRERGQKEISYTNKLWRTLCTMKVKGIDERVKARSKGKRCALCLTKC